jgi:3-hydroxybutyryl-CoA dehydrogenase
MPERTVLVCGAGLMGHGIAQVMAAAGQRVWIYEPSWPCRGRPRPHRRQSRAGRRQGQADRGTTRRPARPGCGRTSLAQAASAANLIVEAVFEDELVKHDLFKQLDCIAPPGAIFASNTSSISITRLAAAVSEQRRTCFVGMHFFSPVPVMPLIELIRGAETSDATEAAVRAIAAELGKEVIVSRDRPGFIVNRVLMPFLARR